MIGTGLFLAFQRYTGPVSEYIIRRVNGEKTTADRLAEFGNEARARMAPAFAQAEVAYPPEWVTLVAIKSDRSLAVYGGHAAEDPRHVITYPVQGQSGELGPKLREGDRQVPEGLYNIEALNPNSRFYVSLRLNYPNAWDQARAADDGRNEPGSDIYIHGQRASVGCLAMGDVAIEELYTLVADCGMKNVRVIIAPVDFRHATAPDELSEKLPWLDALYGDIRAALATL